MKRGAFGSPLPSTHRRTQKKNSEQIDVAQLQSITIPTPRKNTPRELAAGNIDFSIDPPIHSDESLRHQKIFEDNFVLIVRKIN